MIFSPVNLHSELISEQQRQELLLEEIYQLLNNGIKKDNDVYFRLQNEGEKESQTIKLNNEDVKRIFSRQAIKNICIRYRLRFLDTSFFRSEFPYDAIAEINSFEKKHGIKISSFHIIAPSKAFELENINKDPLLFAQLNDKSFYLLHQWGHDLAWYRKLTAWPIQNFKTLIISLFVICFLFAFSLPSSIMNVFNIENEIYLRLWLSIHTFIGLLGFILFYGLTFDKTFSSHCWNSKYYNY